jgi:putative flippase GtrA
LFAPYSAGQTSQDKQLHMRLHQQFLRFAAVGLSGTMVQYVMLWSGVSMLHMPAAVASAIGYLLGSIVNYILNYIFTFQSANSHLAAAPRYFAVLGVGFCINTGLMTLFVHHWGWYYFLAQIITTGIGLCWNFSGSRLWAFKPNVNEAAI